jgi:hypothetical protein
MLENAISFVYLPHAKNDQYVLLLLSGAQHWNGNVLFIVRQQI